MDGDEDEDVDEEAATDADRSNPPAGDDGNPGDHVAASETEASLDPEARRRLATEAARLRDRADRLARMRDRMADVSETMAALDDRLDDVGVDAGDRTESAGETTRSAETDSGTEGTTLPDGPPAAGIEDVLDRLDGYETSTDADAGDGSASDSPGGEQE